MKTIIKSLEDLLGKSFTDSIIKSNSFFGLSETEARKLATEKIDFVPKKFLQNIDNHLKDIGKNVIESIKTDEGVTTNSFNKNFLKGQSPVFGFGCFRLGENGKLYLISKSEHYHTPLGHNLPAYQLLDNARKIGISNATHNNTRGYITRLLEREIIRTVNKISKQNAEKVDNIINSQAPHTLNRIINLQTGSIAVEAGVKMMLSRFYKSESFFETPKYSGKIPVFFVMADNDGGMAANYHGTTLLTQTVRGLWKDLYEKISDANIYKIVSVKINDIEDFEQKIIKYNTGEYKTCGFLHEIILMNYSGIKLKYEFLQKAYQLCNKYDTPTLVDEIQSCMWYDGIYLFNQYDLKPDFVIIGKGFSGGNYASSRIVFSSEYDCLSQFGALVTNGQEELASLSCLITLSIIEENSEYINQMSDLFEKGLQEIYNKYSSKIDKIEGKGHLAAICFGKADDAIKLCSILNGRCIDISAQTYKANCPPAALVKLPLISTKKTIELFLTNLSTALAQV